MFELSFLSVTTSKLTIDNFTFFKEPLGVNDPNKEIIRDAKKARVSERYKFIKCIKSE
jgi:hypothetical protein